MRATKDKFGMIWELTISNIHWKLIRVFSKRLAFNLRDENTVRIIQVNVMGEGPACRKVLRWERAYFIGI